MGIHCCKKGFLPYNSICIAVKEQSLVIVIPCTFTDCEQICFQMVSIAVKVGQVINEMSVLKETVRTCDITVIFIIPCIDASLYCLCDHSVYLRPQLLKGCCCQIILSFVVYVGIEHLDEMDAGYIISCPCEELNDI